MGQAVLQASSGSRRGLHRRCARRDSVPLSQDSACRRQGRKVPTGLVLVPPASRGSPAVGPGHSSGQQAQTEFPRLLHITSLNL